MANAIINVGQTGGQVNISTAAAPATPAAGVVTLYAGTDKALHALNSDGLDITISIGNTGPTGAQGTAGVTGPTGPAGSNATSPITEEQINSLVSTGVGATAGAGANCSVAIGYFAINNAVCSVAVGVSTICSGSDNSTAIGGIGARVGNSAQCGIAISGCIAVVCSTGGIAIGSNTLIKDSSTNSTVIGNSSTVFPGATGTVVLGNSSVGGTGACNSVVIGNSAQSLNNNSIIIGAGANDVATTGSNSPSIIVGQCAKLISSDPNESHVVIGRCACGTSQGSSVVIGDRAVASNISIAIGCVAQSCGVSAIAIGGNVTGLGTQSIAMGRGANAQCFRAIAIGYDTLGNTNSSIALGDSAKVNNTSCASISIGLSAGSSNANCGIAIGSSACVTHACAVALGAGITTEKTNTTHVQSLIAYGQAATKAYFPASVGGTATIDWDNSNVQFLPLVSNITSLTKSNPIDGGVYTVFIQQAGSGSNTVNWGSDIKWAGGTGPTLSTGLGAIDAISLVYIAGTTGYLGNYNLNFA